jgi:hypothetical protein
MIATAFGVFAATTVIISLARNGEESLTPMFVGFCKNSRRRIFRGMTAAVINRPTARPPNTSNRRSTMSKSRFLGAAIASAILGTAALASAPANAAVVACKSAGVPQGCIVRTQPVVVAPVVRPIAPIYRAAVIPPAAIGHVGYTRITPYGVRHVGYTRVWR